MQQSTPCLDAAQRPSLSTRESQILEQIRLRGQATSSSLLASFEGQLNRVTIGTFLRRLEAKGYLVHQREGRRFIYSPAEDQAFTVESVIEYGLAPVPDFSVEPMARINGAVENSQAEADADALVVESEQRSAQNLVVRLLSAVSSREKGILTLLAEGETNKSIAEKLRLSPRTVEAHRWQLTKKLRMKSVAELTKFAIRSGLIRL
jgi:DNA-binding NarL/FixJ family response regulator